MQANDKSNNFKLIDTIGKLCSLVFLMALALTCYVLLSKLCNLQAPCSPHTARTMKSLCVTTLVLGKSLKILFPHSSQSHHFLSKMLLIVNLLPTKILNYFVVT